MGIPASMVPASPENAGLCGLIPVFDRFRHCYFFSFRYWTEGLVHDTQVFHDGHVIYVQVVHNVHVVLSCSSSCLMSVPMSVDMDTAACMDMEHGTRTVEHGPWTMDHATRNMEHGTWNMEHGH
jgi:hypothetical protein